MAFPYATIGEVIRKRLDDVDGLLIHEVYDEGGFGVVRYSRLARGGREYIVHRWAMVDTAGEDIPGGRLYGGYYTMEEDAAKADFVKRSTGGNR